MEKCRLAIIFICVEMTVACATMSAGAPVSTTAVGSGGGSSDGAGSPMQVGISLSPSSVDLRSGQSKRFTSAVTGTSNTTVRWSAVLGSISSSGVYTAPKVATQTRDTVLATSAADPGKYARASVILRSSPELPAVSSALEYWVSPSGDDSSDGSEAHPWATVTHASKTADLGLQGTTVHVAPGTYYGDVQTTANGTATARIRFVSDVQWGATIQGDGSRVAAWVNGNTQVNGTNSKGNYVDIVGFEITGSSGVKAGIVNYSSHVHILSNKVHDLGLGNCGSSNGVSAIVAGGNYNSSDEWVDGNTVYNIPTDMAHVPGNCTDVVGIYFANPGGHAYNNLVYNVAEHGMQTNHYAQATVFANNTIFHNGFGPVSTGGPCHGDGIEISDEGALQDYATIINNIAYDNCDWGIRDYDSTGTHILYYKNLLFENGNGNAVFFQCNPRCGRTAPGNIQKDPLFVNYQSDGSGDYNLRSTSPAVNSGTDACANGSPATSCVPSVDSDGGRRPTDGAWNIGAYQYGSIPATWPWE